MCDDYVKIIGPVFLKETVNSYLSSSDTIMQRINGGRNNVWLLDV
jgi:hypothetical protein